MLKLEANAAAAIIGVGAFEVWKAWNTAAPSIPECRDNSKDSIELRQQLMDADITVGGMALVIGGSMSIFMRDAVPVVLMLLVFACLSFFHKWILNAPSHRKD